MELDQIRTFVVVAEMGTLSRAAIQLSTAQPVLSRRIRQLEEELGVELFHRTGRGVVPTGRASCSSSTRGILDTAEHAKTAVQALNSAPVGEGHHRHALVDRHRAGGGDRARIPPRLSEQWC